jgi:AraC-like DNA-binding protein/mannose-6-phosphate isomerase-like protein (cupin superfamily)
MTAHDHDPHTHVLATQSARLPYTEQPESGGWRKTFAGASTCSRYIPHLGHVRYSAACAELPEHIHTDCFELALILSGRLHWEIAGNESILQPNDCLLTLPGEPHGGQRSIMEPCELIFMQIDCTAAATDPALANLLHALQQKPRRQFKASSSLKRLLLDMIRECGQPDEYTNAAQHCRLTLVLIKTLRGLSASTSQSRLSRPIALALAALAEQPDTGLSVQKLIDASGLCRSEFFRRFTRETGSRPNELITRRKIEQARDLLRSSPASITEIAFELGFSSSQYFSTVFKRHTGHTPCAFRQQA